MENTEYEFRGELAKIQYAGAKETMARVVTTDQQTPRKRCGSKIWLLGP